MRLQSNDRIRDYVLIRTTADITIAAGTNARVTKSHLVHQMTDGAFLAGKKKEPGSPTSTRSFSTGFVPTIPGGPNVILSFDEHEGMDESAVDGTTRDSHPSAIVQLVIMKAGQTDPNFAETMFCIASAVDVAIAGLTARDPLIDFIMVDEVNGCYPNGQIRFVFAGRQWTHPKTKDLLDRTNAMHTRRAEIIESVGLTPAVGRYGTHAIGCMKFTPNAAAKLRQRSGWKPEFEEFVCTCGHRRKTNEFARPSIP